MAFCPKCGAGLPDGSAFCTNCGARLAPAQPTSYASAPRPAAPVYAAPAGYPAPAPVRKKSKAPLILGIVAAVLVIGIVIGVLFLTGVLGAKGPVGTWTLASSSNSTIQPGQLVAVLDRDGKGYLKLTASYTYYDETVTETYYLPLTWTDSIVLARNKAYTYTQDKDSLTVVAEGDTLIFTRTDKSVEKRTALKPGTYNLVRAMDGKEDCTADFAEDGFRLQLNEGGFGTYQSNDEILPLTWDTYFITVDDYPAFYTWDGSNLILTEGTRTITLAPVG